MTIRISDDRLTFLLRLLVVIGTTYVVAGSLALLIALERGELRQFASALGLAPVHAVVVWVGVSAQPRNRLVWLLLAAFLMIGAFPGAVALRLFLEPQVPALLDIETQIPAELPPTAVWIEGLINSVGGFGLFSLLTFGLLLFPDGRLPSPGWRWVGRVVAVGLVLTSVFNLVVWIPTSTVAPANHPLFHLTAPFIVGAPLVSFISLIVRYRNSDRVVRARMRWMLWGTTVGVPFMLVGLVAGWDDLINAGFLAIFGSYGIAIVRHNLFDVDVVISRTLVYGVLAGLIGVIYVSIVVGIGSLVGSADEPNPALAIAATALVAVAFQPARRRLELIANRIVHGRRATPYQVLADFSRRVATNSGTLLDDAARSLVQGTAAERVVISLRLGDERVVAAEWPGDDVVRPSTVESFAIHDGTSPLGSLDVSVGRGLSLTDDDRSLMQQVAAGMGLALHNESLTDRLAIRVDELRESRRRLVAVQDDARRRLERDLHDGVQQQLVAVKVKLGLCRSMAGATGGDAIIPDLERLATNADQAVKSLRNFARGVYPALLEAEGLHVALAAQARQEGLSLAIQTENVGRYAREIESTVYFCVLEMLRNVSEDSNNAAAGIGLTQRNGSLIFRVERRANGAVADTIPDLTRIVDRLDALSGTLDLTVDPDGATSITGSVPVLQRSAP